MTATEAKNIDNRFQYWQENYTSWLIVFLLCVTFLAILFQFAYSRALNRLIVETEQDINHQLELQVQLLESHLEKFRLLPVLMGQHSNTNQLSFDSNSHEIHLWLKQLNYLSGAFDTLILDRNGIIKASAREYQQPIYSENALKNLSEASLQARLGRQYLRINQNRSLYGFSSLIDSSTRTGESLVILVDLEPILQSWAIATAQLIASDKNNMVVMASDASLIGLNITSQNKPVLISNQVFSYVRINTLDWLVSAQASVNTSSITRFIILIAILAFLVMTSLFIVLIRRREKLIFSKQQDKLYAQELAKKVSIKTSELRESNWLLTQEVNDRRLAEAQLKTTQKELIHSAKLAAIGQMSTTLSHEYNQPLATMRTYAENGIKLLAMNKLIDVEDNLSRIIQQTDRLGTLSQMLMSFARKPSDQTNNINIHACVEEAFMLVKPRIKATHTCLRHSITESAMAFGNSVQISQVLLNLLSNSIDAINETIEPNTKNLILVSYQEHKEFVSISVDDSGPGILESEKNHVFEPFYTSKKTGTGLGLGLSIVKDIIKMHQGQLTLTKSTLGGACFTIKLPKKDVKVGNNNDTE